MTSLRVARRIRLMEPGPDPLDRLITMPSAVLADALQANSAVHGLRCLHARGPRVGGIALTVQVAAGDNLALHKAIDLADRGEILMVDAGGYLGRAVLGEVVARHAVSRGIGGIVIDGAVRDADALADLPMPVWCRGTSPLRPGRTGPGAVGITVTVGGCPVNSGDVVVGDADGIVVVPGARAADVADRAEAVQVDDEERAAAAGRGDLDRSWLDRVLVHEVNG